MEKWRLHCGDCRDFLKTLPGNSVDAAVTDPPYGLSFMDQPWDRTGIAFDPSFWAEVLRVLKPGAHLLAAGIGRTHHCMMAAVEDAGFEIRDCIYHVFGSGFPKNLDVSKAIDRLMGAEREIVGSNPNHRPVSGVNYRGVYAGGNTGNPFVTAPATEEAARWEGFGTALKPAVEIWVLARGPLSEASVAENVLKWGTGALNIDGCRIAWSRVPRVGEPGWGGRRKRLGFIGTGREADRTTPSPLGRWPANLVLSHSEECRFKGFERTKGIAGSAGEAGGKAFVFGWRPAPTGGCADADGAELVEDWECAPGCPVRLLEEQGGLPRFFYCAKVSGTERWGFCRACGGAVPPDELAAHRGQGHEVVVHPTQKPLRLMRWLVRLVTPPGGLVLDPFAGSGTTLVAAVLEGFRAAGCEIDPEYAAVTGARLAAATGRGWGEDEDSRPEAAVFRQARLVFD